MQLRYWMILGGLCMREALKHETTIKSSFKFSAGLLTPIAFAFLRWWHISFQPTWQRLFHWKHLSFHVFQREEVQEHLLKLLCETEHIAESAVLGANFRCFHRNEISSIPNLNVWRLQQRILDVVSLGM